MQSNITTHSVGPYNELNYDNYYKVLFRAGSVVQARELNELQTTLAKQTEAFANAIFANNTIVSGSVISNNVYPVITFSDAIVLNVDDTVTTSDGVVCKIIHVINTKSYIVAVIKEVGNVHINAVGSTVSFVNNVAYTAVCNVTANNITAYTVSVSPGIFYSNGRFISVQQSFIPAFFSDYIPQDCTVAFVYTESIVSYQQDATLLDTSTAFINNALPGADRQEIILQIAVADSAPSSIPDGVILTQYKNGTVVYVGNNTEYSKIMDTLANRTYEANGNFTVNKINSTAVKDGNTIKLYINPHVSYINGYRNQSIANDVVAIDATPSVTDYLQNNSQFVGASFFKVRSGTIPFVATTGSLLQLEDASGNIVATATSIGYDIIPSAVSSAPINATSKIYYNNLQVVGNTQIAKIYTGTTAHYNVDLVNSNLSGVDSFIKLSNSFINAIDYAPNPSVGSVGGFYITSTSEVPFAYSSTNNYTIVAPNDGTIFNYPIGGNYYVSYEYVTAGVTAHGIVLCTSVNSTQYTINFSVTLPGGVTYSKLAIVVPTQKVIIPSVATAVTNVTTTFVQPTGSTAGDSKYVYAVLPSTIYKVNYINIVDATTNTLISDATDMFEFYNGQTGSYIGPCYYVSKKPIVYTNIKLVINYNYINYTAPVGGNCIDVNSFASLLSSGFNIADIPTFNNYTYSNYADYRMLYKLNVTGNTYAANSNEQSTLLVSTNKFNSSQIGTGGTTYLIGNNSVNVLQINAAGINAPSTINCYTKLYNGRIDNVYISGTGPLDSTVYYVDTGIESVTPTAPIILQNKLLIATVTVPPVIYKDSDINVIVNNSSRYTMNDIRNLDKRLTNVEDVLALTALESATFNKSIVDANGSYRYVNGFVADNLKSFTTLDKDTSNIALDLVNGGTEPFTVQQQLQATSSTFTPLDNIAVISSQLLASDTIPLAPYTSPNRECSLFIYPNVDTFVDTTVNPIIQYAITKTDTAIGNAFYGNTAGVSTSYNTSKQAIAVLQSNGTSRAGVATTVTAVTTTNKLVQTSKAYTTASLESLTGVSIVPFARANVITMQGILSPATKYNLYVNGEMHNEYVSNINSLASGNLVTSNDGALLITINLPGGVYHSGTIELFVTSSGDYQSRFNSPTYGIAQYYAAGLDAALQITELQNIATTSSIKTTVSAVSTTTNYFYPDPIAESFILDDDAIITGAAFYLASVPDSDVFVKIVQMENGYPTNNVIAKTIVQYGNCIANPTTPLLGENIVKFVTPIALSANTWYALVVGSTSTKGKLWYGKLGNIDLTSTKAISQQPSLGSMFMSQNSSTWTADQQSDLMYKLFTNSVASTSTTVTFNGNLSYPVSTITCLGNIAEVTAKNSNVIDNSTCKFVLDGVNVTIPTTNNTVTVGAIVLQNGASIVQGTVGKVEVGSAVTTLTLNAVNGQFNTGNITVANISTTATTNSYISTLFTFGTPINVSTTFATSCTLISGTLSQVSLQLLSGTYTAKYISNNTIAVTLPTTLQTTTVGNQGIKLVCQSRIDLISLFANYTYVNSNAPTFTIAYTTLNGNLRIRNVAKISTLDNSISTFAISPAIGSTQDDIIITANYNNVPPKIPVFTKNDLAINCSTYSFTSIGEGTRLSSIGAANSLVSDDVSTNNNNYTAVTKILDFVNASYDLHIGFRLYKPINTTFTVYYKVGNSDLDILNNNWTKINDGILQNKFSLSYNDTFDYTFNCSSFDSRFSDTVGSVNNLQFTKAQIKIVMSTSDFNYIPEMLNFRIVAVV